MRSQPDTPRTRRSAYTLIELLIVITVLGIAGAMLVPHIVGRGSLELQAVVRQIIADLSFAQSDALANQEHRRVHFYADGSGYCLVRVNAGNYDDAWSSWAEEDIDYIQDPLAGGQGGRYIVNFTNDARYEDVHITAVAIDGEDGDAEGDLVYDALGGTVMAGDLPGTGGTIVVESGENSYTITVSPFTGKLTVSE